MSQQDLGSVEGAKETAKETAKEVAGEVGTQAKAVAGEAKQQLTQLVDRAKDEVRQTSESKGQEFATTLRSWGQQLGALAEGRPEQAAQMRQYLDQARAKITTFADRLEQGGPQALFGDVAAFARRRPGVFLLGAASAGFLVGRTVRGTAAASANQPDAARPYTEGHGTATFGTQPRYSTTGGNGPRTGSTAKAGDGEVWT